MSNPYHYLFYYTQYNVSKIRPINSREAAILYISIIVFFVTMPFVAKGAFLLVGKGSSGILYTVILLYSLLIYYLNKIYFEKKKVYIQVLNKYKKQSKAQVLMGRTAAWLLLGASFIFFFLILRKL